MDAAANRAKRALPTKANRPWICALPFELERHGPGKDPLRGVVLVHRAIPAHRFVAAPRDRVELDPSAVVVGSFLFFLIMAIRQLLGRSGMIGVTCTGLLPKFGAAQVTAWAHVFQSFFLSIFLGHCLFSSIS